MQTTCTIHSIQHRNGQTQIVAELDGFKTRYSNCTEEERSNRHPDRTSACKFSAFPFPQQISPMQQLLCFDANICLYVYHFFECAKMQTGSDGKRTRTRIRSNYGSPRKSFTFNNLEAGLTAVRLLSFLVRQGYISQLWDLRSTRAQRNDLQSPQRFERQRHGAGAATTQPEMCCLALRCFIKRLAGVITGGDGNGDNLELKKSSFRI